MTKTKLKYAVLRNMRDVYNVCTKIPKYIYANDIDCILVIQKTSMSVCYNRMVAYYRRVEITTKGIISFLKISSNILQEINSKFVVKHIVEYN